MISVWVINVLYSSVSMPAIFEYLQYLVTVQVYLQSSVKVKVYLHYSFTVLMYLQYSVTEQV